MTKEKNQKKLDDITSLIKLLSLFFPGIAVYQYINAVYSEDPNLISYIVILTFIMFGFAYIVWEHISRKLNPGDLINKFYPALSILAGMACILFTGGRDSAYKFIFLFLIISFTIDGGVKKGLIIATICSAFILSIATLQNKLDMVAISIESDIILALMFLTVAWVIGYYVQLEQENITILKDAVNIDALTQLYNHHYFHTQLTEILATKKEGSVAVILLDLDYFKTYNDIHGHLQGDNALTIVANILKRTSKPSQLTARYGGEEFAIILTDVPLTEVQSHAEYIRKQIEKEDFYGQTYLPNKNLTVSIGVAWTNAQDGCHKNDLVDRADKAMYNAKFLHKNAVKTYRSILDQFATDDKELITSIKTLVSVINSRDKITYSHVERVVNYADMMVDALKLSSADRRTLIYGAYMHDVGKINIPTEILNKTSKLTAEEWNILKTHPEQGVDVIQNFNNFEDVRTLIVQHHEKYDGTGYPYGLKGEEINQLSRILTIIDSFDAMTSQRPYHISKTFEQGYMELRRCSGTQFDPVLTEIFIETLQKIAPMR